jgi:hypothetical protein
MQITNRSARTVTTAGQHTAGMARLGSGHRATGETRFGPHAGHPVVHRFTELSMPTAILGVKTLGPEGRPELHAGLMDARGQGPVSTGRRIGRPDLPDHPHLHGEAEPEPCLVSR